MKLLSVFLVGLTFLCPARADDKPPARLTLAGASRQALARNPAIQEALSRWDAARERVIQEGAWDDLQVSAMSRLARFVAVPRNAFADQTISLSQSLPISGRNAWRARAAAAESLMAYEDARRSQLDVVAQTRAAYYRLANARGQVELNRRNLALLEQIADVSRVRYEAGSQGAADVLAAETEAGKLLEAARDLDKAVVAQETQLNILMGRDPFTPVGELDDETAQPVNLLSVENLRALTLANRPEVRSAEHRLDAEKARLELARRAWIPDPAITLEGQRYNGAGQGVSEVDAGISFNIPWTNAPKYSAATREAAASVAAAEQALDASRRDALGLLRNALENVAAAQHHQHLSGETLLVQSRESLKASEIGYEAGKLSLIEWIAAARMVLDVESMRREEAGDYQVAIAELEAVVGAPLTSISNTTQAQ
jgi:cobalt-zinc-cadmium efflux system outer membrane protein